MNYDQSVFIKTLHVYNITVFILNFVLLILVHFIQKVLLELLVSFHMHVYAPSKITRFKILSPIAYLMIYICCQPKNVNDCNESVNIARIT